MRAKKAAVLVVTPLRVEISPEKSTLSLDFPLSPIGSN
jgi:hypothetical protein